MCGNNVREKYIAIANLWSPLLLPSKNCDVCMLIYGFLHVKIERKYLLNGGHWV